QMDALPEARELTPTELSIPPTVKLPCFCGLSCKHRIMGESIRLGSLPIPHLRTARQRLTISNVSNRGGRRHAIPTWTQLVKSRRRAWTLLEPNSMTLTPTACKTRARPGLTTG